MLAATSLPLFAESYPDPSNNHHALIAQALSLLRFQVGQWECENMNTLHAPAIANSPPIRVYAF